MEDTKHPAKINRQKQNPVIPQIPVIPAQAGIHLETIRAKRGIMLYFVIPAFPRHSRVSVKFRVVEEGL